jgi:hypothetical protein
MLNAGQKNCWYCRLLCQLLDIGSDVILGQYDDCWTAEVLVLSDGTLTTRPQNYNNIKTQRKK